RIDDMKRLREAFLRTMTYTTPPGSGNAYSRDFVRKAFAMAPSTIPQSDAILLTLAPMMGDILTIRRPLARYRIHAKNSMALQSLDAAKLRSQLRQYMELARLFADAARELHLPVADDPLSRSFSHLQYRFASRLVEPSVHPFPQDTTYGLDYRLVHSVTTSSQMRLRDKAVLVAWAIACVVAPASVR